ncbi:CTLH/CRA C-terminal to lish motif domain-containing protein [Fomitopsis serialis]|uniref:CTLH/CRA C-terminal to lish motif domain-containing protein n=1 Tax=Fomitopsis serialis TaxID=139415 RepID=UPI002008805D|nr:CTLH/CRA C-terminal to lish motif domain-containing protein [Neoantrodia serialis]KAH9934803.1 CTLH/CRA C-terminal to lish motif domain-containing protein [Neoantrodia serialis]
MDGPLKELGRLQKLVSDSSSSKGKSPSVNDSLDSLLQSLREVKDRLQVGTATDETLTILSKTVETRKREVDERQKEVYNALNKIGKALDKRFQATLPTYAPLFSSPEANAALERTIALHFLRTGQFNTAETFIEESSVDIDQVTRRQFKELHEIVTALREHDIDPALQTNRSFLHARASPLEFLLHRSRYLRYLTIIRDPRGENTAIEYARAFFPPFYDQHEPEIRRLMGCLLYLPVSRLASSPYADLASSSLHLDLEPMFAKEYCASLGMSRQVPLRVVGDIGGGGALARIEKGRKVMRERKSGWSHSEELPIEIPLPPENRYHSIFACPVSRNSRQTRTHQ